MFHSQKEVNSFSNMNKNFGHAKPPELAFVTASEKLLMTDNKNINKKKVHKSIETASHIVHRKLRKKHVYCFQM
jgi:hypothetical protein